MPVSLTYKGKTKFNTLTGGCFSLAIILGYLTYALLNLHELIFNPVLNGSYEESYFSVYNSTEWYNITTNNSTLAIAVKSYNAHEKQKEYLQVVFQTFNTTDGSKNFVPAVYCSDLFADVIDDTNSEFFDNAFSRATEYWVCPDTS